MPKLNHENLGSVQKTAYLTATITTVDSELDTACFEENNKCPAGTDIPIFYHCFYEEGEEPAQRNNGALEGASGAFEEDDEVIVQCEVVDSTTYNPLYVIGFVDKPKQCTQERIYVSMKSSLVDIKRCFVWEIKENKFAEIKDNAGGPVVFPCDPADISDWYDEQESVGESLLRREHCGASENSFHLNCSNENSPLSKEEPSECDPDFINTGSCTSSGSSYDCRWEPVPAWDPRYPGYWEQAGDVVRTNEKHLIWGIWASTYYGGSEKIIFRNGCDIESVFKVELISEFTATEHGMTDVMCSGPACDNFIINREENKTWEFGSPIESHMYTLDSVFTQSGDLCADTGQTQDTDALVTWDREFKPMPVELKPYGVYSDKNIAQVYFVEIQTVSRNAACAAFWGVCAGSGCIGGFSCPWETEEYTFQGLKLVAQVDTLSGTEYPDGTEGVDPTTLPRNGSLETAVSGLYDVLRTDIFEATSGWEESDVLGAYLNQFLILKGTIN